LFESIKVVAATRRSRSRANSSHHETQAIGMPLATHVARLSTDASAGGELLRHRDRDPAEVRR